MEDLVINPGFWQGKSVLLTGHSGFKGSWLSLWLTQMGAKVTGLAKEPENSPNLFEVLNIAQDTNSIIGDICDYELACKTVRDNQPDIVFHLAAQSLVRKSYREPLETFNTNVIGTANMLEALREAPNLRAVVIVTTDKCYQNDELNRPFVETDPLGGDDPYSSSKACAELITHSYRKSFFQNTQTKIASTRAGNVIGGGDWSEDRLIPDLVRALVDNKDIEIRNPEATRPWQHVLEPLSGYLLLAEKLYSSKDRYDSAWNFGPNPQDEKPVSWIADSVVRRWNQEDNTAKWQTCDKEHPHEAHYLRLNSSKSQQTLKWQPRTNIESALDMTINWYRAHHEQENMQNFTVTQIQNFMSIGEIDDTGM